jgi:NADPH:quinone reductase-like Zn-dependent oxidoreductase
MDFAGTVTQVAPDVTGFRPGDRVVGFAGKGGHAEYLSMPETGAIVTMPKQLSFHEAAALPFGGLSALVFLRDFAGVQPGQRVMVIGGSGGVGVYAVQIAKALGAHVTAVAGPDNQALLHELGADDARDYSTGPFLRPQDRFDVILDTVGAITVAQSRRSLAPVGVFLPLNFGLSEILAAIKSAIFRGPRVKVGVSQDTAADMAALLDMWRAGVLRPVIDRVYPMGQVARAYAHVESRHRKGAVILTITAEGDLKRGAA